MGGEVSISQDRDRERDGKTEKTERGIKEEGVCVRNVSHLHHSHRERGREA